MDKAHTMKLKLVLASYCNPAINVIPCPFYSLFAKQWIISTNLGSLNQFSSWKDSLIWTSLNHFDTLLKSISKSRLGRFKLNGEEMFTLTLESWDSKSRCGSRQNLQHTEGSGLPLNTVVSWPSDMEAFASSFTKRRKSCFSSYWLVYSAPGRKAKEKGC